MVTRGVPQHAVFSLIMSINNLEEVTQCLVISFAEDTEMWEGPVTMHEGWSGIPAGWRAGPAGTLTENLARTNAKSHTKEDLPPFLQEGKKSGLEKSSAERGQVCRQTGSKPFASGVPNSREGQQDLGKYESVSRMCASTTNQLPRVSGARAPGLCGSADRCGPGEPAGGMAEPAKLVSNTMELTSLPRCAVGR